MAGRLRIEGPAAVIPEWLLDAGVSDRAVRLYATLHRFAGGDGCCFPARRKLAERMHCSADSVDRAMRDLIEFGALEVQHYYHDDGRQGANNYTLRMSAPVRKGGREAAADGGREAAADGGREAAAQERLPEERLPEEPKGPAPNNGAARWAPETVSIVKTWWDGRDPKPAQPYPAVCDAVERVIRAGWPPGDVGRALERVPTVSVGWLEGELRGKSPPKRASALDATRAAAAAEGLL